MSNSRIVSIMAKNFKGRSFEYAIENRLLILGPNGSGKSAIVQAIQLAIDGFVPGIIRTNPAILDTLGGGSPSIYVEVAIEHPTAGLVRIGRQFAREKSTVREILMVDRRKVDARAFALCQSQCPKAIAVDEFLSMSAQKFMLYLSSKVESAAGLDAAGSEVEKTKETVNRLQRQLAESTSFIAKASENMARLSLPPGSLADVQNEIRQREKELIEATNDLKKLQDEEAERQRKEKEAEAERKHNEQMAMPPETPNVQFRTPVSFETGLQSQRPPLSPGQSLLNAARKEVKQFDEDDALRAAAGSSIRKIIDAMNHVACPTCHGGGAMLVAKGELRKWEGR